MKLKSYWSYLLSKEKNMELQSDSFGRRGRLVPTLLLHGPSSSRGRGKVELNSLCSFFFWREEDGVKVLLVILPLERED